MPHAESILWSKLRRKNLGYKFRRQYSVEIFVLDFYCPELKLAIEIDGDSHSIEGAKERDNERQRIIECYGITFIRFTNRVIYENMDGVLLRIMQVIERLKDDLPPAPSL